MKQFKMKLKNKKEDFYTLGASLLRNILAGKQMNEARERFLRARYGSSVKNKGF